MNAVAETSPGVSLWTMLLNAPLIGIIPGEASVLHAVTMKAIPTGPEVETVVAACGIAGLKLMHTKTTPLWLWPPQHRLPEPFVRCRACWIATGKNRPRVTVGMS